MRGPRPTTTPAAAAAAAAAAVTATAAAAAAAAAAVAANRAIQKQQSDEGRPCEAEMYLKCDSTCIAL